MRRFFSIILFIAGITPAIAAAQQAPVAKAVHEPGAEAGLTIQECLGILGGLNALDQGRRVIVAAGKPTESAETIRYKLPPKALDVIGHDIFVLGQVQLEAQAASRRAQLEIGNGEPIKNSSREGLLFDQRMADYTARPCKVELDHIRDADLKDGDAPADISASVKALLWKIIDR